MNGSWTQINVAGKLADVYEPASGSKPRFGIMHLHGVGLETLAGNDVFTSLLSELNLACICPHGQRSWWTDRLCSDFDAEITPEQHLLENVLPEFESRWGLKPRAIGLTGISMGGQGALRLSFKYPKVFPVVGGISNAVDYHELYGQGTPIDDMYDSKEQCRQDTCLMWVPPYNGPPHIFFSIDPADPWHRGNDRLHEKLRALGVEHTCDLSTQAGGHSWDYFNHMAEPLMRFVYAGLETESLRLL